MKKLKVTKSKKKDRLIQEDNSKSDGIVGMLISLHTFPLESEDDLDEKKGIVTEIINSNSNKKN